MTKSNLLQCNKYAAHAAQTLTLLVTAGPTSAEQRDGVSQAGDKAKLVPDTFGPINNLHLPHANRLAQTWTRNWVCRAGNKAKLTRDETPSMQSQEMRWGAGRVRCSMMTVMVTQNSWTGWWQSQADRLMAESSGQADGRVEQTGWWQSSWVGNRKRQGPWGPWSSTVYTTLISAPW